MKIFHKILSKPKETTATPPFSARLAIYDSLLAIPRVKDFQGADFSQFVNDLSSEIYNISRTGDGKIPFVVIREIIENLIHADFKNAVISIYNNGNTISISDQGPGIKDKERAFLPGFTTADARLRKYIRGVGSGLPIAKETLEHLGGEITLAENLQRGLVVTLKFKGPENAMMEAAEPEASLPPSKVLLDRQKRVLLLVAEHASAGPSLVAKELSISLSTAHRDLKKLQDHGLIRLEKNGTRTLTSKGLKYLEQIFK